MSILAKAREKLAKLFKAITVTAEVIKKYGPEVVEFVVEQAGSLEAMIPDHGFGNIKLLMFDGALKTFVEAMKESGATDEEVKGVWEFAHRVLEGVCAGFKFKRA